MSRNGGVGRCPWAKRGWTQGRVVPLSAEFLLHMLKKPRGAMLNCRGLGVDFVTIHPGEQSPKDVAKDCTELMVISTPYTSLLGHTEKILNEKE